MQRKKRQMLELCRAENNSLLQIVTVKEALKKLKQDSINACWKKLWPEAVKKSTKIPSDNE
jgi:hypothetical protein